MKTLFLIRHGHAESKQSVSDEERKLDSTGIKEVKFIADKLLKGGLRPQLIVSSHANRAYQTAQIVAETLGYPVKNIKIENDIYYTGDNALIDVIKKQDDKVSSIMLAGHNPSISHVAQMLTNKVDFMPTASILMLECQSPVWQDILNYDVVQKLFLTPEER